MRTISRINTLTKTDDTVTIYTIEDFPYEKIKDYDICENRNKRYVNIPCAFDIETTSITKEECGLLNHDFGFMYVWQFCMDKYVCMGREWSEFQLLLAMLYETAQNYHGADMVIYVHNLPFEFQFFRNFLRIFSVFATDKREVVKCNVEGVEFRCSYKLSNMGLQKFLEKTKGVIHQKESGEDFDYRQKRYPDTELTEQELWYCVCDVLGLCEALKTLMEEDTLITIPITSTGYVRREFRERTLKDKTYRNWLERMELTEDLYYLCKEASRGAIAGSNAINTNITIEEVDSYDIKSSYPYQMMTQYFPSGRWIEERQIKSNCSKLMELCRNCCCIITWVCDNLVLKKWEAIPYISKSKCKAIYQAKCGNGKVYSAKRIGMTCTEIDLKIIMTHYNMENLEILEIQVTERGLLHKAFREVLGEFFQKKTDLEDGDIYLYNKYKNRINSAFGMMLTDILNPEIKYKGRVVEPWIEEPIENVEKALKMHYKNKNTFLAYQHGIWVLAHGRKSLVEGMDIVGSDIVQVDTDSVKAEGDYHTEFENINERIRKKAESFDVKPYAIKNGKKHYLGIWEHEGQENGTTYTKFRTLGAKKYCAYVRGKDGLKTTVSGLYKSAGEWFDYNGGIDIFKPGITVPATWIDDKDIEHKGSGRTTCSYMDMVRPVELNVNGHVVKVGSSICLEDSTYTLGVTDEWLEMIPQYE